MLEPARLLLGGARAEPLPKGRGEGCVLEKHTVLFFLFWRGFLVLLWFFKELENCAEIESTLLLTLVVDLENFSLL